MTKGHTEEEFLDGLAEMFLAEGVRALTIGEIAERMRCSRRRLYGIAETKDEIFCAMVKRFFQERLDEGDLLVRQQAELPAALAAYLDVGVRAAARISAAFLKDVEDSEAARAAFDEYQQARAVRLSQLIDQGVSEGVFAACHGMVVAEVILGAALRLRRPAFLARTGLTIEEAFQEFYRVFLGGLLTKAASPASGLNPIDSKGKSSQARRSKKHPTDIPDDEVDRLLLAAWNRS